MNKFTLRLGASNLPVLSAIYSSTIKPTLETTKATRNTPVPASLNLSISNFSADNWNRFKGFTSKMG